MAAETTKTSGLVPSFRPDLNLGTSWTLPDWSIGPRGDARAVLEAAKEAGYRGIQGGDPGLCREVGLIPTTAALHPCPGGLSEKARQWADAGFACATLLVGTGLADDDTAARLAEEVLEASTASLLPLYVETHRGTITQDIWRTVQLVHRLPELRFNGDFSHWYTGHELAAGDLTATLEFLGPVLDRTRYFHGRIGTAGSIQVDIDEDRDEVRAAVIHFRSIWTRAFQGFVENCGNDSVPAPGLEIGFAPELLPPWVGYGRLVAGTDREECDRWAQGLELTRIAGECFTTASGSRTE